ncbi:MAG: hypothetical protein RL131_14, partial [Bacteroidota bacterium]
MSRSFRLILIALGLQLGAFAQEGFQVNGKLIDTTGA